MPKKKTKKKPQRGANRPKKKDVEAFHEGEFTPLVKRIIRNVKAAETAFKRKQKADAAFESAIDKIEARISPDGSGTVMTHPNGKLRLMITKNRRVSGNALAEEAARLVNEYASELISDATKSDDEKQFARFLTGIIERSKSQIKMNKNLTDFMKMKFDDPRLKQAQKLFGQGFDAMDSKRGAYLQVLDDKGKWQGARWNDDTGEWEAS